MPKYMIEREIPNAGMMSKTDLANASSQSCNVIKKMGPQIQWVESYVTDNMIYCIYIAPNANMIRDHAERADFPANSVQPVVSIIEPTTAET